MSDSISDASRESLREMVRNEFFSALHRDFGLRKVEEELDNWHELTWVELEAIITSLLGENAMSSCNLVDWEEYHRQLSVKWKAIG